jgi:hypothetical protein
MVMVGTVAGPLIAILLWLVKIDQRIKAFMIEHEILIADFTGRQNPPIRPEDLPTRKRNPW